MEEVIYGISSKTPLNPRLSCSLRNCACRYLNYIWVSERLKLVYFETPKCGCSSIKQALGLGLSPLHFETAYLIQSQRHCADQSDAAAPLTSTFPDFGAPMTPQALRSACFSAAKNLRQQQWWSDPVGPYEFMHFFGTPEQVVDLFPGYKKFIVLRNPFERLVSTWNMFYNSSDLPLEVRVLQCADAWKESQSFEFFAENMWTCPNHHFDRIVNFASLKVLAQSVDLVPFSQLDGYWEGLRKSRDMPPLGHLNVARSYLQRTSSEADILENERFRSYYQQDYELMKLAH